MLKFHIHTSNSYRLTRLLASCQENDILLRSVDVVILKQKNFVNAMALQLREFQEDSDWTCQRLFYDKIFLASDLLSMSRLYLGPMMCGQPYIRLVANLEDPCVLSP